MLDCFNQGGGDQCRHIPRRSAKQIYVDMMMCNGGFTRKEAERWWRIPSRSVVTRCTGVGTRAIECKTDY
jgi:hypothetical protein